MSEETSVDTRHLARVLAVQYLFTKLKSNQNKLELDFYEPNFLLTVLEERKFDNKLYSQIIEGVEETKNQIDEIITQKAPEWPIEKINPIDLIILRIAIWEGFISKSVPERVAVNEAIELGKVLSTENSSSFINGVLGSIINEEESNDKTKK